MSVKKLYMFAKMRDFKNALQILQIFLTMRRYCTKFKKLYFRKNDTHTLLVIPNKTYFAQRAFEVRKNRNITSYFYLTGFINDQSLEWNFSGELLEILIGEHAESAENNLGTPD